MYSRIAILKVLSSYPEGRASFDSLRADLAILRTKEWLARMKALAARAPQFSLAADGLIVQDDGGWTITASGRAFLESLEMEALDAPSKDPRPQLRLVSSAEPDLSPRPRSRSLSTRLVAG
jgi:hypothetical protein